MKLLKTVAVFTVFVLICTFVCRALMPKVEQYPLPEIPEIPSEQTEMRDYSDFAKGEPIFSDVSVGAKSALLCTSDGLLIYEKNADVPLPMASITKLMTVICALEAINDVKAEVLVPDKAIGIEGSSVYLAKGERVTYEMLMYSAMLESANDATTALAILCGGSEESFVSKMNEKAKSLSMNNTHFCNPHGLHENEHYTTARDYVKLMSYALENEQLCDIIATKKITFAKLDNSMMRVLTNHNRLLFTYKGMLGGKTGFTKTSGRTLITAAKRNDTTLICITLNDGSDWHDHTALLDRGFETVKTVCYDKINATVPIGAGDSESLSVKMKNRFSFSVLNGEQITYKISLPHIAFAPIKKDEQIGKIDFYKDGKIICTVPLIAENTVEQKIENKKGFLEKLRDFILN